MSSRACLGPGRGCPRVGNDAANVERRDRVFCLVILIVAGPASIGLAWALLGPLGEQLAPFFGGLALMGVACAAMLIGVKVRPARTSDDIRFSPLPTLVAAVAILGPLYLIPVVIGGSVVSAVVGTVTALYLTLCIIAASWLLSGCSRK